MSPPPFNDERHAIEIWDVSGAFEALQAVTKE
jgi:hypothetical protein